MDSFNKNWLPHLHPDVVSEIEGNYLDAYAVALEGWRRGLTLKWHVKNTELFKEMLTWYVEQPGQLFSLHNDEKSHYFFRTRGDKVSNKAVSEGMDKESTKTFLQKNNLSTPRGKQFSSEATIKEFAIYAEEIGYPVVVKPSNGSFGRGVYTNITTKEELARILNDIKEHHEKQNIIIEEYIESDDYRLYVVGEEVVGANLRVPANIVGDGVNKIDDLIQKKNQIRDLNPRLSNRPIKIDQDLINYISKKNYMLSTVLAEGEVLYLSDKANISSGGDPIDVLDEIDSEAKEIAVKALQSIPGFTHGAVDVLISKKTRQSYVLELNPTAQIGGMLFPIRGKARDIPKAIIDYYFPETKDVYIEREKIYFDFYDVLDPLISRQALVTTVNPALTGEIHMKKYVLYGDVQDQGYQNGLRKQAFERGLHGHILKGEAEEIEVVVAGTDLEMVEDFKEGIYEDEERATVEKLEESNYDSYFNIGFDSRLLFRLAEKKLNEYKTENDKALQEVKKLEKEKRQYLKSKKWILTSPIRLVGKLRKL